MRAPGPTLEDPEADVSLVGEVTALAQSPDGRTLAVGYASGTCVHTCGERGWCERERGGMSRARAAFDATSHTTPTSQQKGAINLFEAGSGALNVTLHGHRAAVAALCFARSGAFFVHCSTHVLHHFTH